MRPAWARDFGVTGLWGQVFCYHMLLKDLTPRSGFGLQALELEVLEVGLVALIEFSPGWVGGIHAGVSSRNIAKSPQQN